MGEKYASSESCWAFRRLGWLLCSMNYQGPVLAFIGLYFPTGETSTVCYFQVVGTGWNTKYMRLFAGPSENPSAAPTHSFQKLYG